MSLFLCFNSKNLLGGEKVDSIDVCTQTAKYPIYFEGSFDFLLESFKIAGIYDRKICVIADTNTEKIYGNQIISILKNLFKEVYIFKFEAGEKNKNLDTIQSMYDFFLKNHLDRKSIVVALGGGVTGDMAGFAASTYMRGIDFVQIPTSLLAQVDSSVGGKVGVDFKGSKNIVGAFYQPKFVYINVNTLKTLPEREFNAGMAETIKYGIIVDKNYYRYIDKNKSKIESKDESTLKYIIKSACEFKSDIVSKDEKESGIREILNFGHTFGHAIETIFEFRLIHGECVSIGMVAAAYASYRLGKITETELENLKSILKYFKLPIYIDEVGKDKIYSQMFLDKKVSNNRLNFILLNRIGEAFKTYDLSKDGVLEAIEYIEKQR